MSQPLTDRYRPALTYIAAGSPPASKLCYRNDSDLWPLWFAPGKTLMAREWRLVAIRRSGGAAYSRFESG
jgi:hypothetical protein